MLAQLRPLLLSSSPDDPQQRIAFNDGVELSAPGGCADVKVVDGRVYLGLSLRNVGTGIAVLHGAHFYPERSPASPEHAAVEDIRRLTRDLYIAPGKLGFWQTAFRDGDPDRELAAAAIAGGEFGVDLLYGDYEGGQRVFTRFGCRLEEDGTWNVATGRHWQIDRSDPR
jgi:hypothetical protein